MATPPNLEEGKSTSRPPKFNGKFNGWWKTRVYDFIIAKDSELMDVILTIPHVPMNEVKEGEIAKIVSKTRRKYNKEDHKKIEKNFKVKKLFSYGIRSYEYNHISVCESAKEIGDC